MFVVWFSGAGWVSGEGGAVVMCMVSSLEISRFGVADGLVWLIGSSPVSDPRLTSWGMVISSSPSVQSLCLGCQ